MTRHKGLSLFVVVLSVTILGLVLTTLAPLWIAILLINPRAFNPFTELATKRVTKEITKMMFARAR